jgi:uncharacterized protein YbjT (DUF2867 family)
MGLTVLVAGATGRFCGICELLLVRGHEVRAMTRTPSSLRAQDLREHGVDVVTGDFDDPAGLTETMRRVDAVFASGTLHRAGAQGELRHGRNIADAAETAGVAHLVYVSGADAVSDTGVPLFEVKAAVEEHLGSLDIPLTIVAPTYFMENLFNPWSVDSLRAGRVRSFVPADRPVQQTALSDVLAFAVLAVEHPDRFAGERIEIASDEITAEDQAATLARVIGRSFHVEVGSPSSLGPGLAALFRWLDRHGHSVNIASLRRDYPDVGWQSFEEWAELQARAGAL